MSSFRGSPSISPADMSRSPRVQNSSSTSWENALTLEDRKAYAYFFKIADEGQKGFITGQEAVSFFAKSGVPSQILAEIWEAVDKEDRGFLTPEAFTMALKLISCAQHGYEPASPLLSTAVPLPQFEGVSISNSPRLTSPFQTNIEEPHSMAGAISAASREKYSKMFLMAHPVNGVLDAESARNIFMKSNLSVDQLAQIWNLADTRRSGTLNQTEFVIAMHYIAGVMDGSISSLPSTLPPAVYNSAAGRNTPTSPVTRHFSGERSLSPSFGQRFPSNSPSLQKQAINRQFTGSPLQTQPSLSMSSAFPAPAATNPRWDVTDQEKQKFDNFFDKIDARGTGVVQGNDAVEFFQNSRLPEAELAQIWDLADTQQRGKLSRDEFAVAMHLIHKRLGGQPIPRQLPATLVPPSSRSASQPTPPFSSSNLTNLPPSPAFASSPAVRAQAAKSLMDDTDLLGDFDNSAQITTDTNQVNQLQNQISDTISSTNDIRKQKLSIEETLARLQQQKQEFSAQLAQLQLAFNQENGDLQKLQETLNNEQPDLQRVRQEAETVEANLNLLRNQKQEMERKIQDGRSESEQLRRRVTEIQEEAKLLKLEIQNLQSTSRKQDMMLDINRRQVTSAEMDKSATTRELNEVREERGLPPRDPSEKINAETQPSVSSDKIFDENLQRSASPSSRPSTAQSFQQTSMPFTSAFPTRADDVASPAMTMNSFDAAFEDLASPTLNTSLPKERAYSPFDQVATSKSPVTSSFPDISAKTETDDAFAAFSNATPKPFSSFDDAFGDLDETKDTAAQPQQDSGESVTSAFDDTFLRRRGTDLAIHEESDSSDDDDEVLSKVQARKSNDSFTRNVSELSPTAVEQQEVDAPKQPSFDDFDAAFSGKLGEAAVVSPKGAKDFEGTFNASSFDDFDASFDKPHRDESATGEKGKSKFDAFDFSDFETQLGAGPSSTGNVHDDLDSIFGSSTVSASQNDTKSPAPVMSFDDAFGSFDAPPAPAADVTSSTTTAPAADNNVKSDDKPEIKQLIGMGFSRSQAVDALRRYDNDLEKATNFLLDN